MLPQVGRHSCDGSGAAGLLAAHSTSIRWGRGSGFGVGCRDRKQRCDEGHGVQVR